MLAPPEKAQPAPEKPVVPAPKLRTITLTNRAPIQINEDKWPVIAEGKCGEEHPAGFYCWEVSIRVRHELLDGVNTLSGLRVGSRTIIHAKYYFSEEDHDGTYQKVRVGRLLSDQETLRDLWKHILEVGEEMRSRIDNEHMRKYVTHAVDQCFASLPAHKE